MLGVSRRLALAAFSALGASAAFQTQLAAQGYRMRVYIPFGQEWFPYFMRRLGERPANVGFVVRSLLRESSD